MRLVSFRSGGTERYGAVMQDGIVELSSRLGAEFPTLLSVLQKGALDRVEKAVAGVRANFKLADVELLSPITAPEKIICVGVNYANRNAEYDDGRVQTTYPNIFVRWPRSFVGHDQPLVRPKASEQLDYEGELVLIIGKAGRHISEQDAMSHVAGLTLGNEGSIRDWIRHGSINVTQGKNFEASGSLGPWMVTSDEIDFGRPMSIVTRVNGEVRQNDTTASMIYSNEYLINYLSTVITLCPGDMILTGTPIGAGARFTPPIWLKPGDVVEIESDAVGVLRNGVVDER